MYMYIYICLYINICLSIYLAVEISRKPCLTTSESRFITCWVLRRLLPAFLQGLKVLVLRHGKDGSNEEIPKSWMVYVMAFLLKLVSRVISWKSQHITDDLGVEPNQKLSFHQRT